MNPASGGAQAQIKKLEKNHAKHIAAYGEGNERRLTGKNETSSMCAPPAPPPPLPMFFRHLRSRGMETDLLFIEGYRVTHRDMPQCGTEVFRNLEASSKLFRSALKKTKNSFMLREQGDGL